MNLQRYLRRLVWLCVLPLTVVSVLMALNTVRRVNQERELAAQSLVRSAMAGVDRELARRVAALQVLALSHTVDEGPPWRSTYREATVFRDHFGGQVVLIDRQFDVLFSTARDLSAGVQRLPRPRGRFAAELALQTGQPAISDLAPDFRPGESLVAIAVPVLRAGQARLALVATVDARDLRVLLDAVALREGWSLVLADGLGTVIARRGDAPAGGPDDVVQRRFQARSAAAAWSTELAMPQAAYRGELLEPAGVLAAGIALALGLGVLAARRAGRRLAAAVQRLAQPQAPADGGSGIDEVEAVRRLIDEAARQREQAAQERDLVQARLRAVFDAAHDGILTVDRDHRIVMANPAAAAMFQRPLDSLIGGPLDPLIPEPFRARHRQQMQAFGDGDLPRRMGLRRDVTGLRANGEAFPLEASISHLRVAGTELYTVVLRDVTEHRRAQADLQASEARQRQLLAMLPEAVVVHTGQRISYANRAAQRMLAADEAGLLGLPPQRVFEPGSPVLYPDRLRTLPAAPGAAPLVRERVRGLDGTPRDVEAAVALVEDHGEPSVLAVMRDTTDLLRMQATLQASQEELRRLLDAQDSVQQNERRRIARELHDDLQQTLAAIRMDLALAGELLATDPAATRGLLAKVDALAGTAIASARRIVADLRPQLLEDLGLLPALEALVRQFGERSGVACRFEPAADLGEDLQPAPAVGMCLYRVVQEALNNVGKHARAQSVVVALAREGDGQLRLRVVDDGGGFAATQAPGAGAYGLLGMRERVRAVGGQLRVDSQPGGGTVVQVRVPMAGPDDAVAPLRGGGSPLLS